MIYGIFFFFLHFPLAFGVVVRKAVVKFHVLKYRFRERSMEKRERGESILSLHVCVRSNGLGFSKTRTDEKKEGGMKARQYD